MIRDAGHTIFLDGSRLDGIWTSLEIFDRVSILVPSVETYNDVSR